MRLYSNNSESSIRMHDDPVLRKVLTQIIEQERLAFVIETGTHYGLGSTVIVAESFSIKTPPHIFITIEANWFGWRVAKKNLAPFEFIKCLWGTSVRVKKAIEFIKNDEYVRNHEQIPDIFIDNLDNPMAFYVRECSGKFNGNISSYFARYLWDRVVFYKGENLLTKWLRKFRDKNPLVILDSSGGIGFLEFSILREIMGDYPYVILLDDIHHIKHFRSLRYIEADSTFNLIGMSRRHGWALAKHRGLKDKSPL